MRSPLGPRSSGALSSERPIGVRPLPSSALTLALEARRGRAGRPASRGSCRWQPSARETPLSSVAVDAQAHLRALGHRADQVASAALAASSRVPPSPACSFIESEPSRMISTERSSRRSSWAAAGAAQRSARTGPGHSKASRGGAPGRSDAAEAAASAGCGYSPLRILSTAGPTASLILSSMSAAKSAAKIDGEDGEDAAVLDGGLAPLLAETEDEVLDGDGGADADVLHGGDPLSRSCGRLTDLQATFAPGVPPEAQVST